ncbi:MAG: class I tRNA ligase family protein, partial [Verrucomicrobiota bacterium]
TEAATSPRRRSTQTALHRMVTRLSQMLAPMLAFTSDEAWGFIQKSPVHSVHLSTWVPGSPLLSQEETGRWEILFGIRTRVLPELEKARQAKRIGKALDARVELGLESAEFGVAKDHRSDLQELLNVSGLEVQESQTGSVTVHPASEAGWQKCDRCWHWDPAIGQEPGHPGACPRCIQALRSLSLA